MCLTSIQLEPVPEALPASDRNEGWYRRILGDFKAVWRVAHIEKPPFET